MTTKLKLLTTDAFREAHGGRLSAFDSHVESICLSVDLDPANLDIGFFSPDCYPDQAADFMTAALGAPRLRWLQTFSAGVDHPIFATLTERGVTVTNASGASAVPISHAVAMNLLALGRRLPESMRHQTSREWVRLAGRDLADTTTVILGFGPIGRAVADLLPAFGSRVIALRRSVRGDEPGEVWSMGRLLEALAIADQLVLALPATPQTTGLIDATAIAALSDDALVVNVGRGEVIDEPALIEAIRQGRLGGVALDVFSTEPLPETSPLWELPNVIVTPHIAARTPSTDAAAVEIFFDNMKRFIEGAALINEI